MATEKKTKAPEQIEKSGVKYDIMDCGDCAFSGGGDW